MTEKSNHPYRNWGAETPGATKMLKEGVEVMAELLAVVEVHILGAECKEQCDKARAFLAKAADLIKKD